ncbi:hypothetical protein CPB83DRAFT_176153 [Crepidotus variabilis]|uniref:Uncharacterized protein n=1 Tax=Crepidotus variabilis TaxID=179855 RepID=A0A9P6JSB1_9AGAR|nr:hypothetical protein CPB83DRAFT_176153 [Crepidotus variabilis]
MSATPLDYRLPSTVKSIQQGWLISCQSSAVISGLLSVISLILLLFFEEKAGQLDNATISRALNILGYTSFLLNISACTTCFIILDRLGDVPFRAAQNKGDGPPDAKISLPSTGILREYGIGALWRWIVWHWLICFLCGFWAILAQILIFAWVQTSSQTKIVVTCIAAFCLLPCVAFILAPVINGLSNIKGREDLEASPGTPVLPLPHIGRPLSGIPHTPIAYQASFPQLRSPQGVAPPTPSLTSQRSQLQLQTTFSPPQSPADPYTPRDRKRTIRKSMGEKTFPRS